MATPPISDAAHPVIEMQIRGLMLDPDTNRPIVILKDVAGESVLPIWVGIFEAQAIAFELEKTPMPRPMTHDLLRNVIDGLNARLIRIVLTAIQQDTYYAVLWLDQQGETVAIDARPSDAIALALRSDCPIYVSREVLEHTKNTAAGASNISADELRRWLEGLNDDDLGRYKM